MRTFLSPPIFRYDRLWSGEGIGTSPDQESGRERLRTAERVDGALDSSDHPGHADESKVDAESRSFHLDSAAIHRRSVPEVDHLQTGPPEERLAGAAGHQEFGDRDADRLGWLLLDRVAMCPKSFGFGAKFRI